MRACIIFLFNILSTIDAPSAMSPVPGRIEAIDIGLRGFSDLMVG